MHRSRTVQDDRPRLDALGIRLYYLPAYSPELNAIEPWFEVAKYTDMPVRTYYSVLDLTTAVNQLSNPRKYVCNTIHNTNHGE